MGGCINQSRFRLHGQLRRRYNVLPYSYVAISRLSKFSMAKKKAAVPKKSAGDQPDFETSLAEVERIVANLESGELGLSESLQQYESGIKQLKRCNKLLDAAEQRVSQLAGFDADGNPVTEPFDQSSKRTGAGRTTKGATGNDQRSESMDDEAGLF